MSDCRGRRASGRAGRRCGRCRLAGIGPAQPTASGAAPCRPRRAAPRGADRLDAAGGTSKIIVARCSVVVGAASAAALRSSGRRCGRTRPRHRSSRRQATLRFGRRARDRRNVRLVEDERDLQRVAGLEQTAEMVALPGEQVHEHGRRAAGGLAFGQLDREQPRRLAGDADQQLPGRRLWALRPVDGEDLARRRRPASALSRSSSSDSSKRAGVADRRPGTARPRPCWCRSAAARRPACGAATGSNGCAGRYVPSTTGEPSALPRGAPPCLAAPAAWRRHRRERVRQLLMRQLSAASPVARSTVPDAASSRSAKAVPSAASTPRRPGPLCTIAR